MARGRRDLAAGIFHVYTHSVWAAEYFRDDRDRMTFLRELARATSKAGWICLAFGLMGTHYHLIVDVDDGALARGMHALNFRFACAFNERHRMKGHVHGARYDSRRIESDTELLRTFKYVVLNPVDAGLCESPSDWPWSSYPSTVGLAAPHSFVDPSRIVGCFNGARDEAVAGLRRFVEET
jgi:putative transposase